MDIISRPHTHRPDGLGAGRRGFGDEQPAVIGMQGIDAHVDHFEGRSGSGSPLGLFARGIELRAGGEEAGADYTVETTEELKTLLMKLVTEAEN